MDEQAEQTTSGFLGEQPVDELCQTEERTHKLVLGHASNDRGGEQSDTKEEHPSASLALVSFGALNARRAQQATPHADPAHEAEKAEEGEEAVVCVSFRRPRPGLRRLMAKLCRARRHPRKQLVRGVTRVRLRLFHHIVKDVQDGVAYHLGYVGRGRVAHGENQLDDEYAHGADGVVHVYS